MKSKTSFGIICFACIFVAIVLTYIVHCNYFQSWLGEYHDFENIFTPAGILFSVLASAGAVWAVVKQGDQITEQQFENNFYELLSIYQDKKKTAAENYTNVYSERSGIVSGTAVFRNYMRMEQVEDEKDEEIGFEAYYSLLKFIYDVCMQSSLEEMEKSWKSKMSMKGWGIFSKRLMELYDDNTGRLRHQEKDILRECYRVMSACTKRFLYDHFRHLYALLKYVQHANVKDKAPYLRIIRSQFCDYEAHLLYYHALFSAPRGEDSKYQELIEDNCLFHNLKDYRNLLLGEAGYNRNAPDPYYAIGAFEHQDCVEQEAKWRLYFYRISLAFGVAGLMLIPVGLPLFLQILKLTR